MQPHAMYWKIEDVISRLQHCPREIRYRVYKQAFRECQYVAYQGYAGSYTSFKFLALCKREAGNIAIAYQRLRKYGVNIGDDRTEIDGWIEGHLYITFNTYEYPLRYLASEQLIARISRRLPTPFKRICISTPDFLDTAASGRLLKPTQYETYLKLAQVPYWEAWRLTPRILPEILEMGRIITSIASERARCIKVLIAKLLYEKDIEFHSVRLILTGHLHSLHCAFKEDGDDYADAAALDTFSLRDVVWLIHSLMIRIAEIRRCGSSRIPPGFEVWLRRDPLLGVGMDSELVNITKLWSTPTEQELDEHFARNKSAQVSEEAEEEGKYDEQDEERDEDEDDNEECEDKEEEEDEDEEVDLSPESSFVTVDEENLYTGRVGFLTDLTCIENRQMVHDWILEYLNSTS